MSTEAEPIEAALKAIDSKLRDTGHGALAEQFLQAMVDEMAALSPGGAQLGRARKAMSDILLEIGELAPEELEAYKGVSIAIQGPQSGPRGGPEGMRHFNLH